MKNADRQKLKEDGMTKGVFSVLDYLKEHTQILIKAGMVAAGVVVIVFAVILVLNRREAAQSKVASEIMTAVENLGQNPANLSVLERLAGNGKYNRLAYLELAKYWMAKGDLPKADGYVAKLPVGRKDGVYYQGELLKARISVLRKDYDRAVTAYKKIIDERSKDFPLDYAMFSLAEAYELKGDNVKALEMYKEVASKYAQSSMGYQASLKAGRLALAN